MFCKFFFATFDKVHQVECELILSLKNSSRKSKNSTFKLSSDIMKNMASFRQNHLSTWSEINATNFHLLNGIKLLQLYLIHKWHFQVKYKNEIGDSRLQAILNKLPSSGGFFFLLQLLDGALQMIDAGHEALDRKFSFFQFFHLLIQMTTLFTISKEMYLETSSFNKVYILSCLVICWLQTNKK